MNKNIEKKKSVQLSDENLKEEKKEREKKSFPSNGKTVPFFFSMKRNLSLFFLVCEINAIAAASAAFFSSSWLKIEQWSEKL